MSQRTIVEFNHDYAHDVEKTPEIAKLLGCAMASGSHEDWETLKRYGIQRIVQLHHSDKREVLTDGIIYPIDGGEPYRNPAVDLAVAARPVFEFLDKDEVSISLCYEKIRGLCKAISAITGQGFPPSRKARERHMAVSSQTIIANYLEAFRASPQKVLEPEICYENGWFVFCGFNARRYRAKSMKDMTSILWRRAAKKHHPSESAG